MNPGATQLTVMLRLATSAASAYVGGDDISPHLAWSGAPEATKSFGLTMWDPDAPTTVGFTHWLRFDIPVARASFAAGSNNERGEWIEGIVDTGVSSYMGMAPPAGDDPHHYIFTIYALDVDSLGIGDKTTYAMFRFQIRDHILDSATVTGRYSVAPS